MNSFTLYKIICNPVTRAGNTDNVDLNSPDRYRGRPLRRHLVHNGSPPFKHLRFHLKKVVKHCSSVQLFPRN